MENQEYIIRLKDKTKDFTIVYNACFKDNTISMQAMGLFAYLMTLPNDWEIHKEELVSHFSNGRDAVLKAFDELVEKGYIVVEEIKGDKGQFGKKVYKVYEVSQGETKIVRKQRCKKECSDKEPVTDNHKRETVTGNPLTENPILLNTDNTKDLLPSTNNKSSSPQPNESSYKPFVPQEENSDKKVSAKRTNSGKATKNKIDKEAIDSFLNTLSEQDSLVFDKCVTSLFEFRKSQDSKFNRSPIQLAEWKYKFALFANESSRTSTEVLNTLNFALSDSWWSGCMYNPDNLIKNYDKIIFKQNKNSNKQSSTPRSYQQPRQFDENHLFF